MEGGERDVDKQCTRLLIAPWELESYDFAWRSSFHTQRRQAARCYTMTSIPLHNRNSKTVQCHDDRVKLTTFLPAQLTQHATRT